jgi:glyoxylase-like metal-dependent hydrolase (beta-lactamase superfamily II)/rhodanese-related sulfurtransferase
MNIKQFYDEALAHASYAIVSEGKMAVVDPARDPKPYYDFAKEQNAEIVAIFETHPHADFVSSHLQIHKEKNAPIYVSGKVGADYPHEAFDGGKELEIGKVTFKAIDTPGHSPDSITIVATDNETNEQAAFTGDTLFVGDVGRPDLRESAGKMKAKREELAEDMYDTIHSKLLKLSDKTLVYPAHGAGSLCGKNMGSENSSVMSKEKETNWALQEMSKESFVKSLLEDQPFVPKYFGYNVDINKEGAESFEKSTAGVKRLSGTDEIPNGSLIIDVRQQEEFKKGHLEGSINIMLTEGDKFETWLGSTVNPEEEFYLVASDKKQLEGAIERSAKIGYEKQIKGAAVATENLKQQTPILNLDKFKSSQSDFIIVDIRNASEVKEGKIFENAIAIPLHQLRERAGELPQDKPVVVHCAGGFRSAAGASILEDKLSTDVYDLSVAIKEFNQEVPA